MCPLLTLNSETLGSGAHVCVRKEDSLLVIGHNRNQEMILKQNEGDKIIKENTLVIDIILTKA